MDFVDKIRAANGLHETITQNRVESERLRLDAQTAELISQQNLRKRMEMVNELRDFSDAVLANRTNVLSRMQQPVARETDSLSITLEHQSAFKELVMSMRTLNPDTAPLIEAIASLETPSTEATEPIPHMLAACQEYSHALAQMRRAVVENCSES